MYNDTEWYKVVLYCKEKWYVNLVLKSKQASQRTIIYPYLLKQNPFR